MTPPVHIPITFLCPYCRYLFGPNQVRESIARGEPLPVEFPCPECGTTIDRRDYRNGQIYPGISKSRDRSTPPDIRAMMWPAANPTDLPPSGTKSPAGSAVTPREGEQAGPAASGSMSPEEELALGLRRQKKMVRALLVEYMIGRDVADVQDIAVAVHDHRNTSEKAISLNCRRTNKAAERLGSPFRYQSRGGKVFKSR